MTESRTLDDLRDQQIGSLLADVIGMHHEITKVRRQRLVLLVALVGVVAVACFGEPASTLPRVRSHGRVTAGR